MTIATLSPIVGMHYRPPAKALLQVLPQGAQLYAIPEPENPHDHNAIKVMVKISEVPQDQWATLITLAGGFGVDESDLRAREEWHLGYIARDYAAMLAPRLRGATAGKLVFGLDGKPQLDLTLD